MVFSNYNQACPHCGTTEWYSHPVRENIIEHFFQAIKGVVQADPNWPVTLNIDDVAKFVYKDKDKKVYDALMESASKKVKK